MDIPNPNTIYSTYILLDKNGKIHRLIDLDSGVSTENLQDKTSEHEEDALHESACKNYNAEDHKVFINQFIGPKMVMNSREQVKLAIKHIDETCGAQLALLYMVCTTERLIKPGCKYRDFIRALIHIHAMPRLEEDGIKKLADQMRKKIHPDSKTFMDMDFRKWGKDDYAIGKTLYHVILGLK